MEGWYRSPAWRIVVSYRGGEWLLVWPEESDYGFVLSQAKWTRRRISVRDDPNRFKLQLFGLVPPEMVTYVSLMESTFNGNPAWVIEGLGSYGERFLWWISKNDLVIRKAQIKGGWFEFDHARERKQGQVPVTTLLEFEVVELDVHVPRELFEVPPNVPLAETIDDEVSKWLFGGLVS